MSAGLALAGHSVLLIDADAQSSATSGYGIRLAAEDPSTYDLVLGNVAAADAARTTMLPSLRVIGASRDLVGAEIELVPVERRESRLRDALVGVREQFAYILIDCPPSLGLVTLNALTACDSLLIRCSASTMHSSRADGAARDRRARPREPSIPTSRSKGLLLTMYDGRNTLCRQVAEDVKEHFRDKVFRTVIPRNVRLSESPSHGLPALLYDPASRGALAYGELAREIAGELGNEP